MKPILICLLTTGTLIMPVAHAAPGGSTERVRIAGAAAIKEPRREDYRGAIQSYAYVEARSIASSPRPAMSPRSRSNPARHCLPWQQATPRAGPSATR